MINLALTFLENYEKGLRTPALLIFWASPTLNIYFFRLEMQMDHKGMGRIRQGRPRFWRHRATGHIFQTAGWSSIIGPIIFFLELTVLLHNQEFQIESVNIKVPVFYCLMEKFKSLNFYQKFFSLILTNLDQTHRDLLKITTKNFW